MHKENSSSHFGGVFCNNAESPPWHTQASLPSQLFMCLWFGSYSPHPISYCEAQGSFRKSSQKEQLKTLAWLARPGKPSFMGTLSVTDWENLPCIAPSDLSTTAVFFCSWLTLHKYSFTHHWENYKPQSPFSPCLSLLNPFSTSTSSFSLFYCYALSLINRCLFVSDLWFAKPSPPYGSGEAILVFLVLQFSQECNFLGERKKQN